MAPSSPLPVGRRLAGSRRRALLLGALIGILAVAIRASLQPVMGDNLPFAIAFPAAVIAAVQFGGLAGATTAIACALAVVSPELAPNILPETRPLQVGVFLVGSIVMSLLCGQLRAQHATDAAAAPRGGASETPLTAWLRAVLWGAALVPATVFLLAAWWGYQRAEQDAMTTVAHACDLAYLHAQRTLAVTAASPGSPTRSRPARTTRCAAARPKSTAGFPT